MIPHTGAEAELTRIVGGPHPVELYERLTAALTAGAAPEADRAGHGRRTHHALRRLAKALPPARDLLGDPYLLALMSTSTATADPPLYLAALSHYVLCLGSVLSLAGDPAELRSQLDALESGYAKGVFLATETGDAGSHLALRTTARFDAEQREFVLTTPDAGAAKFAGVGALGEPQTAVVCARLQTAHQDCGVFSFLVNLCDEQGLLPGVRISAPLDLGTLPLDHALVRFDGVRLPYRNWLRDTARIDDHGTFHDPLLGPDARLHRTLSVGQALWATLPSALAAMARQCAVLTLRHSTHRRSNGRLAPGSPVLAYRIQQHAVLGALAESFALTCMGNAALDAWQRSPGAARSAGTAFSPWAAVDPVLSVYKAHAASTTARLAAECQHRCGLAGYLDLNRLAAYQGFAHAFDSAGGDNRLILLDTGLTLAERPRPADGGTAPPSRIPPRSLTWWPTAARAHEARLTAGLRRALHRGEEHGLRGLELWNPLLTTAYELGAAHASRLAAEQVARTVGEVRDPELAAALRPLAALYGVAEARRLSGGLLSTQVLGPGTVRALPRAMDELCDLLLPRLRLLEGVMGSPGTGRPVPLGAADYARALADSLAWSSGGRA
ncbi:acyl-CoA dehydrogenase [Streptoverticillium reticulum]|uniref:acyl-CoA dehydrogenase family protein n=1 Tax=Streptoverticillium reticulum TaxID=1433415 RepID=UPI0039BF4D31